MVLLMQICVCKCIQIFVVKVCCWVIIIVWKCKLRYSSSRHSDAELTRPCTTASDGSPRCCRCSCRHSRPCVGLRRTIKYLFVNRWSLFTWNFEVIHSPFTCFFTFYATCLPFMVVIFAEFKRCKQILRCFLSPASA